MPTAVLRWDDYRTMPWKNGGGTTREVASATFPGPGATGATGPAGATGAEAGAARAAEAFDWRVSIADVAAEGPFSAFPGIARVITLVDGEAMVLTVDGTPHRLEPLAPFAFPGAATTDCRLPGGPARDMNVMTREGRAAAEVSVRPVDGRSDLACARDETLLVMALSGGLRLVDERQDATPLGRLDCVRQEGAGTVRVDGEGTVAAIRIVPGR
ncbi:HutD/Ves family protein [Streptomyces montanisoli]|uniref:HutD family protein n=1 Tax=Streptomyces montanisoli TaxID=2798581 RepID=A0A940MCL1_9ACTN|nr:HutD family protein [Streptomyces montanisoli]MBP0457520.1 HutD family protein [Streptomyces montanisoli]